MLALQMRSLCCLLWILLDKSKLLNAHDVVVPIYNVIDHSKRSSTSWIQHSRRKHRGSGRTGAIKSTASALGLPSQRREFTQMLKRANCDSTRRVPSFFEGLSSVRSNRDSEPCDILT